MAKMSNTHHPTTTSAKFSTTVKSATMILQIYDAQINYSEEIPYNRILQALHSNLLPLLTLIFLPLKSTLCVIILNSI